MISASAQAASVARLWNEETLAAIRIDFPHPPVHARNLFHSSIAMWDAWAAYDPTAVGYLVRENPPASDVAAARREAVSYAAYRVLYERYGRSVNATTTRTALTSRMTSLGFNPANTTEIGDSPAAVGNRIAATVLAYYGNDGSGETSNYADPAYAPVNDPLILSLAGTTIANPNRWQPLAFEVAFTQNGLVAGKVQIFLGSQWGSVRPFALSLPDGANVYLDPGLPPQLGGADDAGYKSGNLTVIRRSSTLNPTNGVTIDISPGALGNNRLGANDGTGHTVNPATQQAYAPNVVPHGDYGRVIAEFWADGPESETPPGHWNVLANKVSDSPGFERRVGGTGPVIDELEWDVKTYFALNAAVHDAAVAVWGCKARYDYVRPISSIRHMGGLGQSSDPGQASYHPSGLPLESGLVEVVTTATAAAGQRHAGMIPGTIVILAWGGEPANPSSQFTGTKWIRAVDWLPYQRDTFVTPAFAGYTSGHSAFSRAAAEVLTRMTGSEFFPGGIASFTAPAGQFLKFEFGPSVDVNLQWATYYDAADEAGISRLYGGIHVPVDDGPGRIMGSQCGIGAWDLAKKYFDGSILSEQPTVALEVTDQINCRLRWAARRGFRYSVESSGNVTGFGPLLPTAMAESDRMEANVTILGANKYFFRLRRD
ncbi:MAG: vanadium-dependent haloperoxidase [Verrucomicrobiae bacterium]|nr:vanadium-dependent haloperoxidase [Verrucomicrobiae bacterium]